MAAEGRVRESPVRERGAEAAPVGVGGETTREGENGREGGTGAAGEGERGEGRARCPGVPHSPASRRPPGRSCGPPCWPGRGRC